MTPFVVSVRESTPIYRVAALMLERGVHHVPVVGEAGELRGMVSAFDFVRALAGRTGERPPARAYSARRRQAHERRGP